MAKKPLWSTVKLRFKEWEGDWPEPGDVIRTATGRTYEVKAISGYTITCQVVPPDIRVEGREFRMWWSSRPKKPASKKRVR